MASIMRLGACPAVRVVDAHVMPMLWVSRQGPTIVLPKALLDRMSREHLRCILGHEMAHYVRRDHWANAFVCIVTALFWWNPIVWFVRREIRSAQEVCCDALVLASEVGNRRTYAEMLLAALEFVNAERPLLPELANGIGKPSSLHRRFEML